VRRTYFRQTADVLRVLKYHPHITDGPGRPLAA
jgi:hypothetical protein